MRHAWVAAFAVTSMVLAASHASAEEPRRVPTSTKRSPKKARPKKVEAQPEPEPSRAAPPEPSPPPPAPPPPTPAEEEAPVETVKVHLESAGPITLARKVGRAGWKTVCIAPCNIDVPVDESYRVSGASIAPSDEFRLKTNGGNADVVVRESSRSRYTAGGVIVGLGALVTASGIAAAVIGAAWAGQHCDAIKAADARGHCEGLEDDGAKIRNVGFVAMGVGVVAVLSGAWLMVDSARTTVKQPGTSTATRTPTWQSKAEPVGRLVQVPIVAGSF